MASIFNLRFLGLLGIVDEISRYIWKPYEILIRKYLVYCKNIDLRVWPYLPWPWPELYQRSSWMTSFKWPSLSIYVQNDPHNMSGTASLWTLLLSRYPSRPDIDIDFLNYYHHSPCSCSTFLRNMPVLWVSLLFCRRSNRPESQKRETLYFDLWPELGLTHNLSPALAGLQERQCRGIGKKLPRVISENPRRGVTGVAVFGSWGGGVYPPPC